ncbi:MAG: aldehyde dehydrogenase family protein, partial [Desulfobacterales bacterium]
MPNAMFKIPLPTNEPVKSYAPGSPERAELKTRLKELCSQQIEIPLMIGGEEIKTDHIGKCVLPHNHGHMVATYHKAGEYEVKLAVKAALDARKKWTAMDWHERISVFIKAADLLAGPWRSTLN